MTHAIVTRYIANITFMVGHTPRHLVRARDRARALGDAPLTAFFEQKLREEVGHVVWGEDDLQRLAKMAPAPANTSTTRAMEVMAAYIEATIDGDPALYLPYISFTEYVTVLLGPELLAMIEERCGIPRSAMSLIDKHIELDREHAEEAFGILDDLVGDPRKLGRMRASLAEVLRHFDAFCEEVTRDGVEHGSERRHVSAA